MYVELIVSLIVTVLVIKVKSELSQLLGRMDSIMKKAAVHNLGCKVNAYEAEAMQQMLEEHGYEIVPFSEKADVYVINTCSVTNVADKKSRQMLRRAKRQNPQGIVVAAGCYVQTGKEQDLADCEIDILIGNNKKHDLIALLEEFEKQRHKKQAEIVDINAPTEYEPLSIGRSAEHTRAFLKVQDGCNQFCSYCIIPYARGRVRSRSIKEALEEARRLAANGHKELVLTGIHLSSYGADCGTDLLHLIQAVHEVEGIRRIRLGSLEPKVVTREFAKKLSGMPKVCPHFHLSLQSGCDTVLKRMNRKYTAKEYRESCEYLREFFEHPAITTDVIVGFPGETEEEFEVTRRFLQEVGFFEVHVFPYSKRQGTKAAQMQGQVSEGVKTFRSRILTEDKKGMGEAFASWYQGRFVEVLWEEETCLEGKRCYIGHTPEYVKTVYFGGEHLENKLVRGIVKRQLESHVLELETDSIENID